MISKNRQKYLRSLDMKKHRDRDRVFVAEGRKLVGDLLGVFQPVYIAATAEWLQSPDALKLRNGVASESRRNEASESRNAAPVIMPRAFEIDEVTDDELRRISAQDAPQQVLAVFRQPDSTVTVAEACSANLCLALDDVQNPGNLGTIIRLADWFGIEHIFCSRGCADVFNPKAIQATMGGIAHVSVHYVDLAAELAALPEGTPVYSTHLDGDNIYRHALQSRGVIVMGNEGKGVSPAIAAFATHRLYIPNYPEGRATAESLNVAIATAVVCAEFRRQNG